MYTLVLYIKVLFVLLVVSTPCLTYAQERIWTKQTKIAEVVAFEKDLDPEIKILSKNVSLSPDYYPLLGKYPVTNPIIIERQSSDYLPLYAEYFYTPGDSILRLVSYDWEKDKYGNFFEKQKLWKEESKRLEVYNQEYEKIKASLMRQLGKPSADDKEVQVVKGERGDYLTRSAVWESEAAHADLNFIFEAMTYRIRLTLKPEGMTLQVTESWCPP